MTLKIRYGNGAVIVVRERESRSHGEGRQLKYFNINLGRCVIHYEKSRKGVKQSNRPQQKL